MPKNDKKIETLSAYDAKYVIGDAIKRLAGEASESQIKAAQDAHYERQMADKIFDEKLEIIAREIIASLNF